MFCRLNIRILVSHSMDCVVQDRFCSYVGSLIIVFLFHCQNKKIYIHVKSSVQVLSIASVAALNTQSTPRTFKHNYTKLRG